MEEIKTELLTDDLSWRSHFQREVTKIVDRNRVSLREGEIKKVLNSLNSKIQSSENCLAVLPGGWRKVLGALEEIEFSFVKPEKPIALLSRTGLKTGLNEYPIQLKVELPKEILDDKDYLNHIYAAKKHLYLQCLQGIVCDIDKGKMEYWRDDLRSPYLVFDYTVSGRLQKFALFPVLEEGTFPYRRFLAQMNNVRRFVDQVGQLKPTPHYNMTVLRDMIVAQNNQYVDKYFRSFLSSHVLVEAFSLLKVWLRCLRLDTSDGFDETTWMLILARGSKKGLISTENSSLSVFYSIMSLISSSKLKQLSASSEDLWNMEKKLVKGDETITPDVFRKIGMEFFVDATGGYNLAWDVSSRWMKALKQAATRTATWISSDNHLFPEVQASLMLPEDSSPFILFDNVVKVEIEDKNHTGVRDKPRHREVMEKIERLLTKGLTDRFCSLRFLLLPCSSSDDQEKRYLSREVFICCNLNEDVSRRIVDKGPSAEDKKASRAFRSFWGNLSTLRKFQDGTTCEAVSWKCGPGLAHEIPDRIVVHLLQLHLGLRAQTQSEGIASLFEAKDLNIQAEDYRKLKAVLLEIPSILRGLVDLTFRITSVQEVSSSCRRTACFGADYNPLADDSEENTDRSINRCIQPVLVVVDIEMAEALPADAKAIARIRTKCAARLSLALKKAGYYSKASRSFVDFYYKGFVFRIELLSKWEEGDNELARLRKYHWLIKRSADLFPSFSLAVNLVKSWMSCHYFDYHIDEILVELMAVYVYQIEGCAFKIGSHLAGFYRVLELISRFPWGSKPLVVDVDQELSKKDILGIVDWYARKTEAPESFALMICTPFDKESSLTKAYPDKATFARLQYLARKSLALSGSISDNFREDCRSHFDVLIHLYSDGISNPERGLHKRKTPSGPVVVSHIPTRLLESFSRRQIKNQLLVGFDPVHLFWECLNERFGSVAAFYCNRHGGDYVGVHWKPQALVPTQTPDIERLSNWIRLEDASFAPDIDGILSDIAVLGNGLVHKIQKL